MVNILLEDVSVWFSLRGKINIAPANGIAFQPDASGEVGAVIDTFGGSRPVSKPLDNISLEISEGQSVGLVGANGAGKTTLLKVLSKAMEPQEGRVQIEGTPTSLLSIAAGVNHNLSGYDNIIQRGLWLGHSKSEMNERLPEIAEATGLGNYLNADVSIYSAGMLARLMFATVTAFDPEILLLDEGMIVGDEAFQRKAHDKFLELMESSGITVLASHALNFLQHNCTHGIWLEKGRVKVYGPIQEVVAQYQEAQMQLAANS